MKSDPQAAAKKPVGPNQFRKLRRGTGVTLLALLAVGSALEEIDQDTSRAGLVHDRKQFLDTVFADKGRMNDDASVGRGD